MCHDDRHLPVFEYSKAAPKYSLVTDLRMV